MTKKLFYENPYDKIFEGEVLSIEKEKDYFKVILKETLFYPEGGGQPYDTGYINDNEVFDVRSKDDVVIHYLKTVNNIEVGDIVSGEIDFNRRYEHMQLHLAEHIVTGVARKLYGCDNVGFGISDKYMNIDLNVDLDKDQVAELEFLVNDVLNKNIPVKIFYPSKEELEILDYRAKLDLTENVRIVEVYDIDRCACCGLHCLDIREIGVIKFISWKKNKGGIRLICLAGKRALNDYIAKHNGYREIGELLSVKEEEVVFRVKKLYEDLNQSKFRESELKKKIFDLEINSLNDKVYINENLDKNDFKYIINLMIEKYEVAYVLSKNEDVFKYAIGSKMVDVREINKKFMEDLDCKGGGSKELVQGNLNASVSIDDVLKSINK
ncbi:MAG: alanyl-tRNA editing protein [Lachnospirales bacterium]